MARKQTFNAPAANPYDTLIQSTTPDQMPQEAPQKKTRPDDYRFSMRVSADCGEYLREMAWRNRTTITEYIARIVRADMEAHPEWRDTVDVLNTPRK